MAPQLYLVSPADADPATFGPALMRVLSAVPAAALLVQRADHDAERYTALAKTCINIGQGANSAVLLQNDWVLAKRLGADGVHIATGLVDLQSALKALKPAAIVGAGPVPTRHDAMTVGELDPDYVWFGPLSPTATPEAADLARWWAQTFEIPAVLSGGERAADHPAEFIALGGALWDAPDPAAALRTQWQQWVGETA